MSALRIALTKGRLEKKTIELLECAGIDCSALASKGRKLLLPIAGGRYEILLAKAPDVITYVENGVCDMGVVGKDTILEHGSSFYELLDLGFGRCRFVLAGPVGTRLNSNYKLPCVATKYPKVARDFFDAKGMDVKIIKIEGSVELAPLLGLSDVIVDIVETGNTLRENGLEVMEEIHTISARLIANIASLKLRKGEIDGFLHLLEEKGEIA